MMTVRAAISPCPNDTFLFDAWHRGLVDTPLKLDLTFADIQQLNELALSGEPQLCKMSFPALKRVQERYEMLPVGCALGRGVGPLIVAKELFALEELGSKRIAIPGELTTAHLLIQRLAPRPLEKHFCLYHETVQQLADETCDAAVIIHEQRFTYQRLGFVEVADLGELWERRTGGPIPLGCLAGHRSLGDARLSAITDALRASLEAAWEAPDQSLPLVLEHAQETEPAVVKQQIDTYVTDETYALSDAGQAAIKALLCGV